MRDVHITITARAMRWLVALGVLALISIPIAALGSHTFGDVGNSNTFHDDIAWLAAAGVTKGCNPPANTEFCPKQAVTREQMAAFMRRLSEAGVVDAGSLGGVDAGSFYTKAEVDALIDAASRPAVRYVPYRAATTIEAGECVLFNVATSSGADGHVTGYTVTDQDGRAFLGAGVMMVAPLRYKWTETNSAYSGMLCAGATPQDMPEGWAVTLVNFPTS